MIFEVSKIQFVMKINSYVGLNSVDYRVVVFSILASGQLFIDAINGFLMRNYSFGLLSITYKLALLFLVFLASFKKIRTTAIMLNSLTVYVVLLVYYYFLNQDNLLAESQMLLKIMIPFLVFVGFSNFKRELPYNTIFIFGIVAIYVNVFVIGLSGIGYNTYNDGMPYGFGLKGWFYAGNELSCVLFVLYYLIALEIKDQSRTRFHLLSFITIGCAALIATKTSMVAILFFIFILSVFHGEKRKRNC